MKNLAALLRQYAISVVAVVVAALIVIAFLLIFIPLTEVPKYGSVAFADGTQIIVEIADSQTVRTKGLSGRTKLAESEGMLFLFPKADVYHFWMDGMKFPIDIVWLSGSTIVDIDPDVQVDSVTPLATYAPDQPVDGVLELKAGFIRRHGIDLGEEVQIDIP